MVLKDAREPPPPAAQAQLSGLKVPPQVQHVSITDGTRFSQQARLGSIFSRKRPNNLSRTAAPDLPHFLLTAPSADFCRQRAPVSNHSDQRERKKAIKSFLKVPAGGACP